ncbi:hypothetical protein BC830DRAFT_1077523 [Chytriomyces sp. MP71]|nr:hypothetical protein BC830DRAFT_1077523 [Chytriomyces sp. MP71]
MDFTLSGTTQVKIQFAETLRNVSLTSEEQAGWSAFLARVRTSFTMDETADLIVSYMDSEGDVITLDSDQELSDLLKYRDTSKALKFNVVHKTSRLAEDKRKSKATPEEPTKSPFDKFRDKISPMVTELEEEFKKSNIGPILEKSPAYPQLAEEAQSFATTAAETSDSSWNPRTWKRGCHSRRFYGHPMHPYFSAATAASRPSYPPRWQGVVCDGCSAKDFMGARFKCTTCADFDLCAECYVKAKDVHNAQHAFEEVKHAWDVQEEEAVGVLNGMGFVEDVKSRELLRRYEGNVERVVEVLLQEAF